MQRIATPHVTNINIIKCINYNKLKLFFEMNPYIIDKNLDSHNLVEYFISYLKSAIDLNSFTRNMDHNKHNNKNNNTFKKPWINKEFLAICKKRINYIY